MSAIKSNSDSFDEKQSFQAKNIMGSFLFTKLKIDGTLFIVWGWISFVNSFFCNYLPEAILVSSRTMQMVHFLRIALPVSGVVFTLYYIFKQRKKYSSSMGTALVYVWVSLFFSMVLVNLIQFNVLHSISFELQHPIFMVLIAFAIVITGGIIRYRLIVVGGIVFGILAYFSSRFALHEQFLFESIAWMIAFIIPGHLLSLKK